MSNATCATCRRVMRKGGGCKPTHVAKHENGPFVERVKVGGPGDWGGPCHDCNAGDGQVHHDGCDAERCPGCGGQMLMCWGSAEALAEEEGITVAEVHATMGVGCGWEYMVTNPDADKVQPTEDPIVKVIYKDEGDFGFITTVRRSEMFGMPPSMPWLEVLALKREVTGDTIGVPYDPNRQRPAGTRREAIALATEHGAEYEEV